MIRCCDDTICALGFCDLAIPGNEKTTVPCSDCCMVFGVCVEDVQWVALRLLEWFSYVCFFVGV